MVVSHLVDLNLELQAIFPRALSCLHEEEKKRLVQEFSRKFPLSGGTEMAGLFPFFLANRKWHASLGFLPELAALEWAFRLAENSPELPCQGFERVTTASEPQWFSAQFSFDPAHAVMESDWPLDEILENPTGSHPRRPGKFLIFRREGKSQIRSIDENEARLLEALSLGVPLGVVLDRPGGPEFDAFLFQEWMQSGLLRAIHWS